MDQFKEISHDDNDYHEILIKLERANENLSLLKNNKEICIKDLHK